MSDPVPQAVAPAVAAPHDALRWLKEMETPKGVGVGLGQPIQPWVQQINPWHPNVGTVFCNAAAGSQSYSAANLGIGGK